MARLDAIAVGGWAVRGEAEIGPEVAPTVTNPAAQKVAQHAHAGGSNEQHAAQGTNAKARVCRGLRLSAKW